MSETLIVSRLKNLAFAAGLRPEQVERLAEVAAPVVWGADTTIFREGDCDGGLYVVEEGRVAIEMTVPGRGRMILMTVGPGEVLGWSSLFYQKPKSAAARTTAPTTALALDADRLRALCDADPQLGYALTRQILHTVSERLKAARLQLLDMFG